MDLTLTQIWHNATIASGCLADAIKAQKDNPSAPVRKDLEEAAHLLGKAYIETKQLLTSLSTK
jgi:cellobiose-specific phosphotransferase system component IIA